MNSGSLRRGRMGRIDVRFDDLVGAVPANVERLARTLGIWKEEPHYDRCRRIARWYKRNQQPKRERHG